MMIEARRAERVRSLLRARIIFNNRSSTIECTIKNMSPYGAKIELGNAMSIPELFDLEVPQKGRTFRARLTWRSATGVGVEFLDDDSATRDREHTKLDRLEQENKKLRSTVAQLTKRLEDLGQDVS